MKITDPQAIEGINQALVNAGGTHNYNDVLNQILRGDAQLWEAEDAVIVTEIHNTPNKQVLHFWLATGALAPVVDLSRLVLAQAAEAGIHNATLAGRRGWERVLAREGWARKLTVMGREM